VLLGEIVDSLSRKLLSHRTWTRRMRNYRKEKSQAKRRKKRLAKKLNAENERNGLKIESFTAWYWSCM